MADIKNQHAPSACVSNDTEARNSITKFLYGKLQAAVRGIRGQDQGGVLFTNDSDSNIRRQVMDVLRDKNFELRTHDLANLDCTSSGGYKSDLEVISLNISEDKSQWMVTPISRLARSRVIYDQALYI